MHAFAGLSTLIQFLEGCESFRMESGVKRLFVLSLLRSVCLIVKSTSEMWQYNGIFTKYISAKRIGRRVLMV
jgi:hypothetical protein